MYAFSYTYVNLLWPFTFASSNIVHRKVLSTINFLPMLLEKFCKNPDKKNNNSRIAPDELGAWRRKAHLVLPLNYHDQSISCCKALGLNGLSKKIAHRWLWQEGDGVLVLLVLLPYNYVCLDCGVKDRAVLHGLLPHGLGQRGRRGSSPALLKLISQLRVRLLFIIQGF